MKISNKIIVLIIFLLGVLAVNTWFGLRQMGKIRGEFSATAKYDAALLEAVSSMHQIQLQKDVLLQKLISIAEELGFEKVNFARSSYLQDELKNIREALENYSRLGEQEAGRARKAAEAELTLNPEVSERKKITAMIEGLDHWESARKEYDVSIEHLLLAVQAGGFQLSLTDLQNFQLQENKLSKGVEEFLKNVQEFARASIAKTGQWEDTAHRMMLVVLLGSMVLALLLAFWIVRSIVRPLHDLSQAAQQIGEGDFNVHIEIATKDELAELANAFNVMGRQLEEFKKKLEQQNQELKTANEDLDRFIQIMAHDIVDPLTMMIGYCSYLEQRMGPAMDTKSKESLNGIRKASTKMHQMVKELLDYTKSKRPPGPAIK